MSKKLNSLALRCNGKGMRGYDVHITESLLKYLCPLCNLVCRSPIQTEAGKIACGSCYYNAIGRSTTSCPIDGSNLDIDKIFSHKSMEREIAELAVKCRNANTGCGWEGKLSDAEKHNKNCESEAKLCCSQLTSSIRVIDLPYQVIQKLKAVLQLSDIIAIGEHLELSGEDMVRLQCSESWDDVASLSFLQTLCMQHAKLPISHLKEALLILNFSSCTLDLLQKYKDSASLIDIDLIDIMDLSWRLTKPKTPNWRDLAELFKMSEKVPLFETAPRRALRQSPLETLLAIVARKKRTINFSQFLEIFLQLKLDAAVHVLMVFVTEN